MVRASDKNHSNQNHFNQLCLSWKSLNWRGKAGAFKLGGCSPSQRNNHQKTKQLYFKVLSEHRSPLPFSSHNSTQGSKGGPHGLLMGLKRASWSLDMAFLSYIKAYPSFLHTHFGCCCIKCKNFYFIFILCIEPCTAGKSAPRQTVRCHSFAPFKNQTFLDTPRVIIKILQ